MARQKKQRRDFEHVGFTLNADTKRELAQRAEQQELTTSQLLRRIVRGYLNGASRAASTSNVSGGAANARP